MKWVKISLLGNDKKFAIYDKEEFFDKGAHMIITTNNK